MNYKVCLIVKDVYEVWVEADSDEAAKELAINELNNGSIDVELVNSGVDVMIVDTD